MYANAIWIVPDENYTKVFSTIFQVSTKATQHFILDTTETAMAMALAAVTSPFPLQTTIIISQFNWN